MQNLNELKLKWLNKTIKCESNYYFGGEWKYEVLDIKQIENDTIGIDAKITTKDSEFKGRFVYYDCKVIDTTLDGHVYGYLDNHSEFDLDGLRDTPLFDDVEKCILNS